MPWTTLGGSHCTTNQEGKADVTLRLRQSKIRRIVSGSGLFRSCPLARVKHKVFGSGLIACNGLEGKACWQTALSVALHILLTHVSHVLLRSRSSSIA